MRTLIRSSIGAAVLALAASQPAAADFVEVYNKMNLCGGDNFATCLSVQIQADGNDVKLWVQNIGPGVITQIGFYNTTGTGIVGSDIPEGWEATTSLASSGGQKRDFGVATTNGANNAIPEGGNGYFAFTFTGGVDWSTVGLAIHTQSGPNGMSTTCLTYGSNANCDTNVIPEPSTVFLLGTGLAGLGIVAWRRRREGEVETEEEA